MHLFYSPDILHHSRLEVSEARHAVRVLRHQVGDHVMITDGRGHKVNATIVSADHQDIQVQIETSEKVAAPFYRDIHLAVAPTKQAERFEWMVEKCTEIGVGSITPLICHHSERRKINTGRLIKRAVSAMKQSGQYWLPEIREAVSFINFLENLPPTIDGFIGWCGEEDTRLERQVMNTDKAIMMIGPEGDFSEKEMKQALAAKFKAVSLGPNTLRTETAGLVALQTLQRIFTL